ncbi:MAG TPA: hypothetical protein VFS00_21365, partial [Polyangiaceae bacterium]|nr:hypothetical protein [Polyangiaceae bacterium]
RVPSGTSIRWERLERVVQFRDDRTRTAALSFAEAIRVEERLERGGFRGDVVVSEADAGDDVKQIHDTLRGRDEAGNAVAVSWTPFKRRPPEGVSPPKEGAETEP